MAQVKRIVVPNVRIGRSTVQSAVFVFNKAKGRYFAHTKGCPDITVVSQGKGQFVASAGALEATAKTAKLAFGKIASELWV